MTSGQKIALSLLSAFALFAAFVLSFHTFLFKEIEMKFYTQAKIEENVQQLNNISESYDLYITKVLDKIETGEESFLKNPAVQSFYAQNPSEKEVTERRILTEKLFAEIPTLDGIRIIDKNGRNVHFSTYDNTDILKQSGISKIYKNYPDIQKDIDEIPYEIISKNVEETASSILFDGVNSRAIIAVPSYWLNDIYSGTALFYFKLRDIEKELVNNDVISFGQSVQIIADESLDGGIVVGVPYSLKNNFIEPILDYYKRNVGNVLGLQTPEKLLEKEDGTFYVALSSTLANDKKVVGVYSSEIFEISTELKILIYICVFISIFLILFLVFSIKRDPVVVLKSKIKRIQYGVIKEYIDNREKLQWESVVNKLKFRQKELNNEILKSLHVHSKKKRKELDEFLQQNWTEIFAVIDNSKADEPEEAISAEPQSGAPVQAAAVNVSADSDLLKEIKVVLGQVLRQVQSEARNVSAVPENHVIEAPVSPDEIEDIEEVEELDDVEEIEEVEELDDVEDIEEVEDLDDVEEIEEVEELEDIEEIEEVEEIDEVEEIEDAEPVEDIEEVEDAEPVEDIEEAEELPEEAETIDEAEPVEDVEDVEDVEEIDEIEEIEELDDAEDIDELDEVEELEEADPDAEVGPIPSGPAIVWDDEFFKNFCGAFNYEYKPSNDTYFASDLLPSVDNLFAEELAIGGALQTHYSFEQALEIKFFPMSEFESEKKDPEEVIQEEIEEAAEEIAEEVEETVEESVEEIAENEEPFAEVDDFEEPEEETFSDVTDYEDSDEDIFSGVDDFINTEDDIEELAETDEEYLQPSGSHFTMTSFGEAYVSEVPELEDVDDDESIVMKDGVFCISDDLDVSNVDQNSEFKQLVDSIVNNRR